MSLLPVRRGRSLGFTLIELLIVIAVIAILAVVVVLVLNPAEILKQSRDTTRLSDLTTLNSALGLYNNDQTGAVGFSLGNPSSVYVSIPDPTIPAGTTSTCASIGFATTMLPAGMSYVCASSKSYRNSNGTGWIPVNFSKISAGNPLGSLPVDPIDASASNLYYTYVTNGTTYELTANLESTKMQSSAQSDGGQFSDLVERGTSLALNPVDYGGAQGSHGVWVGDWNNGRVLKFDLDGNYLAQIGSSGTGDGQFSDVEGMAADANGDLYVVDGNDNRVEKFDSNGNYLLSFGSEGTGNGQFGWPYFVAVDGAGDVYVSDCGNGPVYRVEKFDPNGNYLLQFGSGGSANGQFNCPSGIAFDPSGNIYVTDWGNYRVEKFDPNGNYLSQFGLEGPGGGEFTGPMDIGIDGQGNIWVNDNSTRAEKFSSSGQYLSEINLGTIGGLAADSGGNVYLVDSSVGDVKEYDTNGNLVKEFGSVGSGAGQFAGPYMITVR